MREGVQEARNWSLGIEWRPLALSLALSVSYFVRTMSDHHLPFEVWKLHLRDDCEREGKPDVFSILRNHCLRVLWEGGLEPSVQAIVAGLKKAG